MSRICFVTDELHPVLPGGAGSLIASSLEVLSQRGHETSVILNNDDPALFASARAYFAQHPAGLNPERLTYTGDLTPERLGATERDFSSWYEWRSYRVMRALERESACGRFDIVEFNDFFGSAYYSFAAKAGGLAFQGSLLGVRLHNTWASLMKAGDADPIEPYSIQLRALEQAALQLAEFQLSASAEYATGMFLPIHGTGLGASVASKPALTRWPRLNAPGDGSEPNIILFYGRLQPFKGLDRFLSAALTVAEDHPQAEFCFVGADSHIVRDPRYFSYRAELEARIPDRLKPRFRFLGRLPFTDLEAILPRVRFAVFPNYFESFGYAAHELYAAGLALILPNSPSFAAFFEDGRNALVFDGSIDGLTSAMRKLYDDDALRRSLRCPADYTPNNDLGGFYERPSAGWMQPTSSETDRIPLTIVVLRTGSNAAPAISSARAQLQPCDQLIELHPEPQAPSQPGLLFLGRLWFARTDDGSVLTPEMARTRGALLVLEEGDEFLPAGLDALRRAGELQPDLSFVSCWKLVAHSSETKRRLDTFAAAIDSTELLFTAGGLRPRAWMRTPIGIRLDDLFDIRLGPLGEVGYLWCLEENQGPGLTLPTPVMTKGSSSDSIPASNYPAASAFLVARNQSTQRQSSLAWRRLSLTARHPAPVQQTVARGWQIIKKDPRRGWRAFLRRLRKLFHFDAQ